MRYKKLCALTVMLLIALGSCSVWAGTTGKIAGIISDKSTGEPLPGANVVVAGTALGGAADINGQYTILHVPPGVYDVTISVIGYAKMNISTVRVRIDQTTRVNAALEMEALEGEAVTVVAEKNIIKEDVATSVVAVTAQEVEELPVSNVQNVVGLQAGIQSNLQIRGGQSADALFQLDGVTFRDPRNNNPVSSVALASVQEISVERGGFNAEYGQVRSGIVNVVTKEGSKTAYSGSVDFRYSPPAAKYFGVSPFDKSSMWLRPYFDDDVCWTGTAHSTNSDTWDKWTQLQYPDFEGWNAVSQRLLEDSDPDNDLTPIGAQRKFMWETRKQEITDQPDYNIDAGFGGPVPFLSDKLGNLRFFTSYRREREMLVYPLTRDDYVEYDWNLKVSSDISDSKKLRFSASTGKQYAHALNWLTWDPTSDWYMRYPNTLTGDIGTRPSNMFGTGVYSLADISYKSLSSKYTHMLNQNTFYELSLEHFQRKYWVRPTTRRDTTLYEILPGYFVDAAPFGYQSEGENGITGMFFGGHSSKTRDNTVASSTTLKADLTSQLDFNNLLKTGFEFIYNDLDMDYGTIASLGDGNTYSEHVVMNVKPYRAAFYAQDKMETKGFIMNIGLRVDYSNSNSKWWDVGTYDKSFFANYDEDADYTEKESKGQWQISPRLGISHPITESSKLFFNYGHFKQMPAYETLFRVARTEQGQMVRFGDPNLTLAKTVSYELGYDHTLFNDYLLQLAAFYHDVSDQQTTVSTTLVSGTVYAQTTSNSYEDIRGFELTLRKNRGRWWNFFANYTYQVSTSGFFGTDQLYEDPTLLKRYLENTENLYQDKPVPRPYGRVNLSLYTPDDYGPKTLGFFPLGGYLLNVLFDWQAGEWMTWNPLNVSGIVNNVQRVDYWNVTLRLSKTFHVNKMRIMAYMDIDNLFNTRYMALNNWGKDGDDTKYYQSLHLPDSKAYDNIPGDDRIGTYRDEDVAYQPMERRGVINYDVDSGVNGVIYYDNATGRYVEYITVNSETGEGQWSDIEKARLNKLLDEKAYIDMPNQTSFTFLNPRQLYFGVRLSFDLN